MSCQKQLVSTQEELLESCHDGNSNVLATWKLMESCHNGNSNFLSNQKIIKKLQLPLWKLSDYCDTSTAGAQFVYKVCSIECINKIFFTHCLDRKKTIF